MLQRFLLCLAFEKQSDYVPVDVLVKDLNNYESQGDPEAGDEKRDCFRYCHVMFFHYYALHHAIKIRSRNQRENAYCLEYSGRSFVYPRHDLGVCGYKYGAHECCHEIAVSRVVQQSVRKPGEKCSDACVHDLNALYIEPVGKTHACGCT